MKNGASYLTNINREQRFNEEKNFLNNPKSEPTARTLPASSFNQQSANQDQFTEFTNPSQLSDSIRPSPSSTYYDSGISSNNFSERRQPSSFNRSDSDLELTKSRPSERALPGSKAWNDPARYSNYFKDSVMTIDPDFSNSRPFSDSVRALPGSIWNDPARYSNYFKDSVMTIDPEFSNSRPFSDSVRALPGSIWNDPARYSNYYKDSVRTIDLDFTNPSQISESQRVFPGSALNDSQTNFSNLQRMPQKEFSSAHLGFQDSLVPVPLFGTYILTSGDGLQVSEENFKRGRPRNRTQSCTCILRSNDPSFERVPLIIRDLQKTNNLTDKMLSIKNGRSRSADETRQYPSGNIFAQESKWKNCHCLNTTDCSIQKVPLIIEDLNPLVVKQSLTEKLLSLSKSKIFGEGNQEPAVNLPAEVVKKESCTCIVDPSVKSVPLIIEGLNRGDQTLTAKMLSLQDEKLATSSEAEVIQEELLDTRVQESPEVEETIIEEIAPPPETKIKKSDCRCVAKMLKKHEEQDLLAGAKTLDQKENSDETAGQKVFESVPETQSQNQTIEVQKAKQLDCRCVMKALKALERMHEENAVEEIEIVKVKEIIMESQCLDNEECKRPSYISEDLLSRMKALTSRVMNPWQQPSRPIQDVVEGGNDVQKEDCNCEEPEAPSTGKVPLVIEDLRGTARAAEKTLTEKLLSIKAEKEDDIEHCHCDPPQVIELTGPQILIEEELKIVCIGEDTLSGVQAVGVGLSQVLVVSEDVSEEKAVEIEPNSEKKSDCQCIEKREALKKKVEEEDAEEKEKKSWNTIDSWKSENNKEDVGEEFISHAEKEVQTSNENSWKSSTTDSDLSKNTTNDSILAELNDLDEKFNFKMKEVDNLVHTIENMTKETANAGQELGDLNKIAHSLEEAIDRHGWECKIKKTKISPNDPKGVKLMKDIDNLMCKIKRLTNGIKFETDHIEKCDEIEPTEGIMGRMEVKQMNTGSLMVEWANPCLPLQFNVIAFSILVNGKLTQKVRNVKRRKAILPNVDKNKAEIKLIAETSQGKRIVIGTTSMQRG